MLYTPMNDVGNSTTRSIQSIITINKKVWNKDIWPYLKIEWSDQCWIKTKNRLASLLSPYNLEETTSRKWCGFHVSNTKTGSSRGGETEAAAKKKKITYKLFLLLFFVIQFPLPSCLGAQQRTTRNLDGMYRSKKVRSNEPLCHTRARDHYSHTLSRTNLIENFKAC